MPEKYKINLHIIEVCNFKCRHCFSKFGTKNTLSIDDWKKIVDNCIAGINVTEFNIAGGEPMIYPGLIKLTEYIKNKGLKVSLITNGFYMTEDWIKKYANLYTTIGFSVDSTDDNINTEIGRCNSYGKTISAKRIKELCQWIRKYAPECKIKINTVISKLNKDEKMVDFVEEINADRWKLLRMKPFKYQDFSNLDIEISEEEFQNFVLKNQKEELKKVIIVEPDMKASYILIDSNGCLLDNFVNELTPISVCNCLYENFADGLKRLTLDKARYNSRYKN